MVYQPRREGVHIIPKDISLKVHIIAQLAFEFVYFEAAVKHFSYYARWTLLLGQFGSLSMIS